jgi:hypothetical protein
VYSSKASKLSSNGDDRLSFSDTGRPRGVVGAENWPGTVGGEPDMNATRLSMSVARKAAWLGLARAAQLACDWVMDGSVAAALRSLGRRAPDLRRGELCRLIWDVCLVSVAIPPSRKAESSKT